METRQVTEIKVYKLVLNPMRSNMEAGEIVALSYDKQTLIDWYESQLAPEPYNDEGSGSFAVHGDTHQWHKSFKKDGPLEWYNPTDLHNQDDYYGHGVSHEWVDINFAEQTLRYSYNFL